jgi:hypothetical protein
MEYECLCIKDEIDLKKLKKYGFKIDYGGNYCWHPKNHDYGVHITDFRSVVIDCDGYITLGAQVQLLLFDMFSDGILEKKVVNLE